MLAASASTEMKARDLHVRKGAQSRRFDRLPDTSGMPRSTDINRPARLVVRANFGHLLASRRRRLRAGS